MVAEFPARLDGLEGTSHLVKLRLLDARGGCTSRAVGEMGLKPGQTIRLAVREACTGERGSLTDGFFPDIVLKVK